MSLRVDDYFPFGCGDQVRELDGRHVGTVRAVIFGQAKVRWNDNGILGMYLPSELQKATDEQEYWTWA